VPTGASDWSRHFINLSEYVGHEDVRIAFVARNGNGNNLYIDNIEFFFVQTNHLSTNQMICT
jgi:hypothetical protein